MQDSRQWVSGVEESACRSKKGTPVAPRDPPSQASPFRRMMQSMHAGRCRQNEAIQDKTSFNSAGSGASLVKASIPSPLRCTSPKQNGQTTSQNLKAPCVFLKLARRLEYGRYHPQRDVLEDLPRGTAFKTAPGVLPMPSAHNTSRCRAYTAAGAGQEFFSFVTMPESVVM